MCAAEPGAVAGVGPSTTGARGWPGRSRGVSVGWFVARHRHHHTPIRRWFLPADPDLIGRLEAQAAITRDGLEAFVAWTEGSSVAGERVREREHAADAEKAALREALTEAFTTPLEPEDLFELSQGLDGILNRVKDTVREAEVMDAAPDGPMAEMAEELRAGVQALQRAIAALRQRGEHRAATRAADEAIKHQRHLEHVYRRAMSALIGAEEVREVVAKRELYRRLVRTGDHLELVAERVWYAVLKVS